MPAPYPAPRTRRALAAALLLGVAACGHGGPPASSTSPTLPASITKLDAGVLRIARARFCDLVPEAAVRAALGSAPASSTDWRDGDPVPGTPATQSAHELGCGWAGADGTTARAWVFARPVSVSFAHDIAVAGGTENGCRLVAGPAFGRPTMTQVCTLAGSVVRVRHAGLFGDSWLTCETSGPAGRSGADRTAAVKQRADAWCVAVAGVLDTAR
ncbi:MAG TPA: hypothetical protein VFE15_08800 [Marmoricola sp.]|jgi:hypothetical protein|nr:hypothetical protein [Marmoricola sp.]